MTTMIPLDVERLRAFTIPVVEQAYDERDTILYALGIGLGHDPLDRAQLRFVFEKELRAAPTMAGVLAYPGFWAQHPESGVPWVNVVHAEQTLTWHRPVPV